MIALVCVVCGTTFEVPERRAKTAKYCNYHCHQVGEGRKGGQVTAVIHKARSAGKSYIKKDGVHLHRTLMTQLLKRPLAPGEVVHHKDDNKLNNDPANLELLPSQAEHARRHVKQMLAARKAKRGF